MSSWQDRSRKVTPYIPGEQPSEKNIIKLNTNENPYPPGPSVEAAIRSFDAGRLRKYPAPGADILTEALSDFYTVAKENIFVGVGSDDVLATAFLAFFASASPVLFPDITYSFYDVWAQLYGIPYQTVPLNDDLSIIPTDYIRENGGIVIANPNAPTGLFLDTAAIEDIVKSSPSSVVIVDEAYIDFGGTSILPLISKYDNLLVVRTFSKSRSLAGSRIGFAFGSSELIKKLWDVRNSVNSYTMDTFTQVIGAASLSDRDYFERTCGRIIQTRNDFCVELKKLGFDFPEPAANFVFARHEKINAETLFNALKEEGIYVRWFNRPRISDYLRISIGTPAEMDELINFLKRYIETEGS